MPLSAVNFVPLTGQIKAADIKQFFDLFTGLMTDQPIPFANTLMVGGSQGAGAAVFRINGVAAQTANMVEARALTADVQPLFSIGPTGTLSWGPGGATGTDVTLRRSAPNQLTLTGLAGTPALVIPVGGVTVSGGTVDVTAAGAVRGVPQQNLLVNPGFEIWQRGTSFNAAGYWADRWNVSLGTGASATGGRVTTPLDNLSTYSFQFAYTAGSAISAIDQAFEANGTGLKGKPVTASVRIYPGAVGGVRLRLIDTDGATFIGTGAVNVGTGAYETLTVTGTPATTNAGGKLTVRIEFQSGAGASGTYYLDNATLVVGSVPMDYLPLTPADDLARCLRYYQRWLPGLAGAPISAGQCYTTTAALVPLPLLARMGGVPTLTISAAGDWQLLVAGGTGGACTAVTANTATAAGFVVNATVASGLVSGNATLLTVVNTTGWLALEWNP